MSPVLNAPDTSAVLACSSISITAQMAARLPPNVRFSAHQPQNVSLYTHFTHIIPPSKLQFRFKRLTNWALLPWVVVFQSRTSPPFWARSIAVFDHNFAVGSIAIFALADIAHVTCCTGSF